VGSEFGGRGEAAHGILPLLLPIAEVAVIEPDLDVLRRQLQGPLAGGKGLVDAVKAFQGIRPAGPSLRRLRNQDDDLVVGFERFVVALQPDQTRGVSLPGFGILRVELDGLFETGERLPGPVGLHMIGTVVVRDQKRLQLVVVLVLWHWPWLPCKWARPRVAVSGRSPTRFYTQQHRFYCGGS
jgi:hypothetical protein